MAAIFDDLYFVSPVNSPYHQTSSEAWFMATCSRCQGTQMAVLAKSTDGGNTA